MRYRLVTFVINFLIASLGYVLISNLSMAQNLSGWIEKQIEGRPFADMAQGMIGEFLPWIVITAVTGLFQATPTINRFTVEKIPRVSGAIRRLLAGRSFIEGDWPLVVVGGADSPAPGALVYLGFMTIRYKNGEYKIKGTDWLPDGKHAVSFSSLRSLYTISPETTLIQYFYKQGSSEQETNQRGYTELYFSPIRGRPLFATGEFRDPSHPHVRFFALRKRYRFREARLTDSPAAQWDAAVEAWETFQPHIDQLVRQKLEEPVELVERRKSPA